MPKKIIEEEEKKIENEIKEEVKEQVKEKKSKFLMLSKALYIFFKGVLDVILNNKFIQIVFFMLFFYYFGRSLFRENKVGIFINGTDNFYNYNYGDDILRAYKKKK